MAKKLVKKTVGKKSRKSTTSKYIQVTESKIHHKGIIAACNIKKDTNIIEYVGEKISKKESDIRAEQVLQKYKDDNNTTKGGVYIFELNKKYDIDGNVKYNTARYINHSCNPNCEAVNKDNGIYIYSIKNIKKGTELTYNYGYSLDNYKEHPCKCGSKKCVGYIVAEEYWFKLKLLKIRDYFKRLFRIL